MCSARRLEGRPSSEVDVQVLGTDLASGRVPLSASEEATTGAMGLCRVLTSKGPTVSARQDYYEENPNQPYGPLVLLMGRG